MYVAPNEELSATIAQRKVNLFATSRRSHLHVGAVEANELAAIFASASMTREAQATSERGLHLGNGAMHMLI